MAKASHAEGSMLVYCVEACFIASMMVNMPQDCPPTSSDVVRRFKAIKCTLMLMSAAVAPEFQLNINQFTIKQLIEVCQSRHE